MRYIILTSNEDETDLTLHGVHKDKGRASRRADKLAGTLSNQDVYLFEGTLIEAAIGDEIYGSVNDNALDKISEGDKL